MVPFMQARPCRQPGQSLWHSFKPGLPLCCQEEDLEEEEEAAGQEDLEQEEEAAREEDLEEEAEADEGEAAESATKT